MVATRSILVIVVSDYTVHDRLESSKLVVQLYQLFNAPGAPSARNEKSHIKVKNHVHKKQELENMPCNLSREGPTYTLMTSV